MLRYEMLVCRGHNHPSVRSRKFVVRSIAFRIRTNEELGDWKELDSYCNECLNGDGLWSHITVINNVTGEILTFRRTHGWEITQCATHDKDGKPLQYIFNYED